MGIADLEEDVFGFRLYMRTDLVLDALRMALAQRERSRSQLELAVVEYIAWFNNDRLHDPWATSPVEFESLYVAQGVQLSNR
jgi:transposase InsO family protein